MSAPKYDVIIENGLWFDGLGSPPAVRNLGISNGKVAAISEAPLAGSGHAEVIDARGRWVMPGFVDIHTHYDAELLVAPGLTESVRHGVTTVFVGSCSLSTVCSTPLDCADLFSRVEAVPREHVLGALERLKTWDDPEGYKRYLEGLPLGPNIGAFLGHSDLRASVMGLGRSVDASVSPTEDELARMEGALEAALSAGFLGLSTMTNPWDKLDGDRYRSRPLPSTFASWSEYRRFHEILRRRGRVLQSAPNLTMPLNALLYFLESMAPLSRKALKTTLITAADSKAAPFLVKIVGALTRTVNRLLGSDVRWQHLPVPFQIYADGIDLVVFEELGAGRAALHLKHQVERNRLLQDEDYRRRFRREYEEKLSPRVWNRNFHDAEILACPDASVVGKSFGQVADERGVHPVDAYLDLVVAYGTQVRWRTLIANHRPDVLDDLASLPEIQLGFADSGAHLRNMAFYNFPIRFLRRVNEALRRGRPILSLERAVERLTGELAAWFDVDAGRLCVGDRADVAIIDPAGLDASVDEYREAPIAEFGGLNRMVNRSSTAVYATLIGGRVVFQEGEFREGYGRSWRSGRFLRAGEPRGSVTPARSGAERVAA